MACLQALLTAKWPTALQYHEKSCIRCMNIQADHPDEVAPTNSPSRTATAPQLDKMIPGVCRQFRDVCRVIQADGMSLRSCTYVKARLH